MVSKPIQSGNYDARVIIVGEALGAEELEYGRPFVGVSGQELYRMLEDARWLPPGAAKHIINALHPWYDPSEKRMRISNPNFLPLDKALDSAGIFITNICHDRPPNNEIDKFFATKTEAKAEYLDKITERYPRQPILDGIQQLITDIETIRPQFILALGGTALWALTGLLGITKWRGSILRVENGPVGNLDTKVVPTFHSADVLREWTHRFVVVRDLVRAKHESTFPEIRVAERHIVIRPSFSEAMEWIDEQAALSGPLGGDIETPWGWLTLPGHIACMGFSASRTDAICIPLMCLDGTDKYSYWQDPDDEVAIILAMRNLMTKRDMIFHKGVFDVMHIIRHWGFIPRWRYDTMLMQHVLYPGLMGGGKINPVTGHVEKKGSSLSLAFCASMYCEHFAFWKEEGKDWNRKEVPDEDSWWRYNTLDTTFMFECFEVLRDNLQKQNLWTQFKFMMSLSGPVLDMMMRGMPLDHDMLHSFKANVRRDQRELQEWINAVCGHELNTGSNGPNGQMQRLFYGDLGLKPVLKGRGRDARPTLDSSALETIAKRAPALGPLCYAMIDERSLAHFDENMLSIRLAPDRRAHTEVNLTGTETMRFSSTESCFGEGLNLQNINRMPEE